MKNATRDRGTRWSTRIDHPRGSPAAKPLVFSERDIGFEPTTSSLGSEVSYGVTTGYDRLEQVPSDASVASGDDRSAPCTVAMLSREVAAVIASEAAITAFLRAMADHFAAVALSRA
jgi:hypothetical protein